jgi:hypothetical protein
MKIVAVRCFMILALFVIAVACLPYGGIGSIVALLVVVFAGALDEKLAAYQRDMARREMWR